MKKVGNRDVASDDGAQSPDAAEVRKRVVQAITQVVGEAMKQDWSLLPSGSASDAGADETHERTDIPARDADAVSPVPSTEVPLGNMDEFTASPPVPSLVDRLLSARRKRRMVVGISDHTELLPNGSNPPLSWFRYGNRPYRHLEPLPGGRFEMTGIRPTESDPVPSEFPLSRRRRPFLLSFPDLHVVIRFPWESTGSPGFGGSLHLPATRKLSNGMDVSDDEYKRTTDARA